MDKILETSIYPNPFTDSLNIKIQSTLNSDIKIFNISGKIIFTLDNSKNVNLDLESLSSGIYFISIKNEIGSSIKKIIKK